jgi:hypothetical protein
LLVGYFSLGMNRDDNKISTLTSNGHLHSWSVDSGLSDMLDRGCNKLKYFKHREDVKQVCLP